MLDNVTETSETSDHSQTADTAPVSMQLLEADYNYSRTKVCPSIETLFSQSSAGIGGQRRLKCGGPEDPDKHLPVLRGVSAASASREEGQN